MAARLQLSAPGVTDLTGESEGTKKLYELDHPEIGAFGRQCLLARRLAERRRPLCTGLLRSREHHRGKDPPQLGQS